MNKIELALQSLTLIQMLILTFGAYSYTRLIVTDKFPLCDWFRNMINDRWPPTGHVSEQKVRTKGVESMHVSNGWYVQKGHWLGELISCPWCFGFWTSLTISVMFLYAPVFTLAACFPMALRAAVGVKDNGM
jgi:hypothetical protein